MWFLSTPHWCCHNNDLNKSFCGLDSRCLEDWKVQILLAQLRGFESPSCSLVWVATHLSLDCRLLKWYKDVFLFQSYFHVAMVFLADETRGGIIDWEVLRPLQLDPPPSPARWLRRSSTCFCGTTCRRPSAAATLQLWGRRRSTHVRLMRRPPGANGDRPLPSWFSNLQSGAKKVSRNDKRIGTQPLLR